MKFTLSLLTLGLSLLSASIALAAQNCQPACCDVLVLDSDSNIAGINCTPGGIDCAFSGQVTACCNSINRLTETKVGSGCRKL